MPTSTTRATAHALGWVTAGSMTANVCSYLVHLPASRWLGDAAYGQFAVVLAWLLVVAVPALAGQAVIAREAVRGVPDAALRALGRRLSLGVGAVALVAAPLVAVLTDIAVTSVLPGVLIAPMLTLIATGQGILQGRERFRLLGMVLAATGLLRSVPMIAAIALGSGVAGALWCGLGGAALAAAVAWRIAATVDYIGPSLSTATPTLWTVAAASQVQLAIIIASSLDLLLSRTVLTAADAGVYAVGAVALKVAFWLPQAIGVVFYPKMADVRQTRRSIRGALGVLAVVGGVLIVGAAIGGRLVPIVVGADYNAVAGVLWLFTYTGVVLSMVQLLLLATIAARRTGWSAIAWLVIGVEAVLIVTVADTVTSLIVIAAGCATAAALAYGLTIAWWAPQQPDSDDEQQHTQYAGDHRNDSSPDDLRA